MKRAFAITLSSVLAACGCSQPEQTPPPGGGDEVVGAYDGPELKTTVQTAESHPPTYTLAVEVNCPCGGYELKQSAYDDKKTPRELRLILTSPASDELVIQAFQMHTWNVDLGSDRTPVRVLVSQRQRRAPDADKQPFRLAATVTPK